MNKSKKIGKHLIMIPLPVFVVALTSWFVMMRLAESSAPDAMWMTPTNFVLKLLIFMSALGVVIATPIGAILLKRKKSIVEGESG